MVRVLSLHNFPRQEVMAVDEVVSAAVAPPDIILLAQKNHTILVKNVVTNLSYCVSTVDQAIEIHHSARGNYIASLENRGDISFVRAYLGWQISEYSGIPLRARIAGRVTPLCQHSQGVEMLEIPTPGMPDCIHVCSNSGNLAVCCGSRISIFYFTIQTHDKSRVEFVDLLKAKWTVELSFPPKAIRICEDVIAAYNEKFLHAIRLGNPPRPVKPVSPCESLDYNELIACGAVDTIEFPSVAAEPQLRQTPFLACADFSAVLSYDSPKVEAELKIPLEDLLLLQLAPCMVGSSSRREIPDLFTCMVLKPIYLRAASIVQRNQPPILGSKLYQRLRAVACFFGTQQEGYLHHFIPSQQVSKVPVSVYPFTAPLVTAVLEDSLLHAVTDAGLETYTLRSPAVQDGFDGHSDYPICLLGLRPFLHVRKLLLGEPNLFLIASADSEPSTIYQLALADPETLWCDFFAAAKENQWEAPATYLHLIQEAHHILKVRRESLDLSDEAAETLESLYRKACAVLADHYIMYGDVKSASCLYRSSRLKVIDVTKRIQQHFEKIPLPHESKFSHKQLRQKLFLYLEDCLKIEDERYEKHRGNKEDFYTPDIGSLLVSVLDSCEHEQPSELSRLILNSPLIQTFGSERSHAALSALTKRTPKDTFSFALISVQRGHLEEGLRLVREVDGTILEELAFAHTHIFLLDDNLSEFGLMFLGENPLLLARVLYLLIKSHNLQLTTIQKCLMDQLQPGGSHGKHAAAVLQAILEKEVGRLETEGRADKSEHVGTLTWLYLTQLSQQWEAQCEGEPLYKDLRPAFLEHVPPFGPDLNHILSPQTRSTVVEMNENPKNVLMRLQCLLSSDTARASLFRVRVFLGKTPKVYGSLSIQIQCASSPEALQLLLNFAPQALIPFLKEKPVHEYDWRNVLNQINNKITAATDPKRKFYYQQIEQGVLEHIAQNLTLKDVAELLPADIPARNLCLRVAHNNEQATNIKTLIMMTGAQLS